VKTEPPQRNGEEERGGPLRGVRVLTVEQFGAGPYGTGFLANLGAEVIKIENGEAGGDAARSGGPYFLGEHDSLYFQGWNANKKSVTLDLKSAEGKAAFQKLVAGADAVVNNLRGDQAEKLGLDYRSLCSVNPRIVCGHISAYGRDNSRASRPGYDYLMQAEAGLMSLTGDPAGDPARFGQAIIDYMTGITLTVGLLSCLYRAREQGKGCDVDTSLFEVALHQLNYSATWYLNAGYASTRLPRSSHFAASPVQTFRAADGWIFVMCMTEKFWTLMLEAVGQPALMKDPRFSSMMARVENREALTSLLDDVFQQNTMAHWVDLLGSLIPIGPVYDIGQALENPFVTEIGMIQKVPHPAMPEQRLLANPLRINGRRLPQVVCAPLGANNPQYLETE
jgi:crotonobetainyl-CoA:carnitine CoA-transferase CaiB-like acyl-CoA transferase